MTSSMWIVVSWGDAELRRHHYEWVVSWFSAVFAIRSHSLCMFTVCFIRCLYACQKNNFSIHKYAYRSTIIGFCMLLVRNIGYENQKIVQIKRECDQILAAYSTSIVRKSLSIQTIFGSSPGHQFATQSFDCDGTANISIQNRIYRIHTTSDVRIKLNVSIQFHLGLYYSILCSHMDTI